MAVLRAYSFCGYLTETSVVWRQDDYDANKMVKAIKSEPFRGYFNVELPDRTITFRESNAEGFLPIVHSVLAAEIAKIAPHGAVIVPIPNSHVVDVATPGFRTRALAEGTAAASNGALSAMPSLTFSSPQTKSHAGGSRDPDVIEDAYVLTNVPDAPIVLLDDVMTTGAHFIAAARKLRAAQADVVAAFSFARATPEQLDPMFRVRHEDLDLDPTTFNWSDIF